MLKSFVAMQLDCKGRRKLTLTAFPVISCVGRCTRRNPGHGSAPYSLCTRDQYKASHAACAWCNLGVRLVRLTLPSSDRR
ncbi:hypothetical protein IG631_18721 [Alternaria alternata]|nr:hypothetical protein IG631_18721 [Alternaria alternata]